MCAACPSRSASVCTTEIRGRYPNSAHEEELYWEGYGWLLLVQKHVRKHVLWHVCDCGPLHLSVRFGLGSRRPQAPSRTPKKASASMGCGASSTAKEPPHPAIDTDWTHKEEATRIFKLADLDGNGCLDEDELKKALKNPQFSETAMTNLDTNMDGKVSLREWLISFYELNEKSSAAAKTALKAHEKAINFNKEKEAEA